MLEELGATRLAPRADCDVDYEEPAEGWSKAILDQLGSEAQQPTAPAAPAAMAATGRAIHDKRNPFPATIIANLPRVVSGPHKATSTHQMSLECTGHPNPP